MSSIRTVTKASSNERLSLYRRKIIKSSSISKESSYQINTSKNSNQLINIKNSSYDLKPITAKFKVSTLSTTTKKLANIVSNPTFKRKKVIQSLISPTNKTQFLTNPISKPVKTDFPLTGLETLKIFSQDLTAFEQTEIIDYTEVYFLGAIKNKNSSKLAGDNFGFDDNRNDLILNRGDHIAYRYEILNLIGRGSFGQVCECFDHKRHEKVALKVIRNKKRFHQQATIEVSILNRLREKDASDQKPVVKMRNYFLFRNHVCITFDLWDINLYEMLKTNKYEGFNMSIIKRIAFQLLQGLIFLSNNQVIHCDLKPENILIKHPSKYEVVIIDFGSATFYEERQHMYIQSRFYRAPEIILGIPYTTAIDMWSLGCILVELLTGTPLMPGESEHDQLVLIIELFGYPPSSLLMKSPKREAFFEGKLLKDSSVKNNLQKIAGSRRLSEVVGVDDKHFLDFLGKCFEYEPSLRMTPQAALLHPWISMFGLKHKSGGSLGVIERKALKISIF